MESIEEKDKESSTLNGVLKEIKSSIIYDQIINDGSDLTKNMRLFWKNNQISKCILKLTFLDWNI